jgi:hypothetical protein
MGLMTRYSAAFVAIFGLLWATPAHANFSLDGGANFAVLYVGEGGQTLSINNGSGPNHEAVDGNVGVANTGQVALSGPLTINGDIDFSAANTGQCHSCTTGAGGFINGSVNYSQSQVTSALVALTTLSQTLGAEAGTALTLTGGSTINASSGTLDGSGNRVFSVTSNVSFNSAITINGSASDYVVINIGGAGVTGDQKFHGAIQLTGGITSDHVLINFTNGDYTTYSGGNKLDINTNFPSNSLVTQATFLDLNGAFNCNDCVVEGHIFGGDSLNSSLVSGGDVIAPPTTVPEPATLLLVGTALVSLGAWGRKRRFLGSPA